MSKKEMTPEQLDDLQRLCDAATEGPWDVGTRYESDKDDAVFGAHYVLAKDSPYETTEEHWGEFRSLHGCSAPLYKNDAAFIAASRTAVPKLIARVRELEAMVRDAFYAGCHAEDYGYDWDDNYQAFIAAREASDGNANVD